MYLFVRLILPYAVIRNIEVIGSALNDFGIQLLTEEIPQIPWSQIAGIRNILADEYLYVDTVMTWDTFASQ